MAAATDVKASPEEIATSLWDAMTAPVLSPGLWAAGRKTAWLWLSQHKVSRKT
jgi:hypothetical protein